MGNKISVAIAVYNGGKYLKEQLDSLYSQTLIPDEIVAVDDCSTDNTKNILEEYHKKYGLIYHINETNLGVNKNFEKAISLCSNDYIALCDQDDIWMSHKIETSFKRLKSIENNMPTLVSSGCINVDENLNIISEPIATKDSDLYIATLLGHQSQGSSLMMNRSLLKYILPFPTDSKIIFDIYIGLIAAMVGNKYNIAEKLMYYRHHQSNLCGVINPKKIPFRERLNNKYSNRYPRIVSEGRLYNMKTVANLKSKYFIPSRVELYFKLLSLDSATNILQKIHIIFSIKELSFKKKFLALPDILFSHLFKMIVKI